MFSEVYFSTWVLRFGIAQCAKALPSPKSPAQQRHNVSAGQGMITAQKRDEPPALRTAPSSSCRLARLGQAHLACGGQQNSWVIQDPRAPHSFSLNFSPHISQAVAISLEMTLVISRFLPFFLLSHNLESSLHYLTYLKREQGAGPYTSLHHQHLAKSGLA